MNIGFICIAQNSNDVDYLRMAYLQALSCKLTQPKLCDGFSVIVDKETYDCVEQRHIDVFDNIIVLKDNLAKNSKVKMQNECQIFAYSPYKETIKTEADMLFTSSYASLWDYYGFKKQVFCSNVYTFDGHKIKDRSQRKLFDDSLLPDIYSAWTYFKYDLECKQFYDTMRIIIDDWDYYRDNYLINCRYDEPRTDEVYALACKILDIKYKDNGFGFVHMKPKLQRLHSNLNWIEQTDFEILGDFAPVIGGYKQYKPLHYVEKTFVTDELLDKYEWGYSNRYK
jgi:hypothetical protein